MLPRTDSGRQGVSLVELGLSLTLFAVIVLAAAGTLLHSHRLAQDADNWRMARQAAENELERLRAIPFPDVAQQTVGRVFVVEGLPRRSGDPHGRVLVFLDEADPSNPALPVDRSGADLDGDGNRAEILLTTDRYRVLPVRIEVTFDSASGDSEITYSLDAVLSSREDLVRREG